MQRRMLSALVGIVLLMTLCINVLAASTDTPDESRTGFSAESATIEPTTLINEDVISAQDILDTAYHTMSISVVEGDILSELEDPELKNIGPHIYVNGETVGATSETVLINDTTYVSIRTIVEALCPDAYVGWHGGQLVASGDGFTLTARPGESYIVVNDRYLYVPDGVIFKEEATMAPIRTVCSALGASTQWDVMTRDITVSTIGSPLEPGATYYNSDDLYWLARIITAESRNQPLSGKIAVGTVIVNRVESVRYPNTVHGVIFDGYQFTPTQNGSIYNTPTADSVIAAKLVLEGAREAGDSIFFNRAGMSSWASRNKTYVTTIADHAFYK